MAKKRLMSRFGVGLLKLIFNAAFYFGLVFLTIRLTKNSLFSTKKEIYASSLLCAFSMIFGFFQFLAYDLFRNTRLLKKIFKVISVYTTLAAIFTIYVVVIGDQDKYFDFPIFGIFGEIDFASVVRFDFNTACKLALYNFPLIFLMFSCDFYNLIVKKNWSDLNTSIATVIFPALCYAVALIAYVTSAIHVFIVLAVIFVIRTISRILSLFKSEEIPVDSLQHYLNTYVGVELPNSGEIESFECVGGWNKHGVGYVYTTLVYSVKLWDKGSSLNVSHSLEYEIRQAVEKWMKDYGEAKGADYPIIETPEVEELIREAAE